MQYHKTFLRMLSLSCTIFIGLTGCGKADRGLAVPTSADEAVINEVFATVTKPVKEDEVQVGTDGAEDVVICVYVCGAVRNATVAELPEGSRVRDALAAAGGFTSEADRNAVNLAGVLTDGQMVYFPEEGEGESATLEHMLSAQSGKVNINTADAAQLCTLPGVGPSRAEAIIAYRQQNGAFCVIEDIMKVTGIKEGAFEKIRDLITVK